MGFLSFIVTWLYELIGNFGVAVVASLFVFFAFTLPFRFLSAANAKAKKKCQPELKVIRKKYNATQMGVDHSDTPDMPEEIKKMSYDERDEAMANEISALYKKNGYHMWTAWIPTLFTFVVIILAYSAIREASPEGFWRLNLPAIRSVGVNAENQSYFYFLGAMLFTSLLSPGYTMLADCIKHKKAGKPIKGDIISGVIGIAITLGLSIWVATSVSTAIALAITTLYMFSFVNSIFNKYVLNKRAAASADAEEDE